MPHLLFRVLFNRQRSDPDSPQLVTPEDLIAAILVSVVICIKVGIDVFLAYKVSVYVCV